MKLYILSFLSLIFIISSCSIEKRRFQPGYHIEFKGNKNFTSEVKDYDEKPISEEIGIDRNTKRELVYSKSNEDQISDTKDENRTKEVKTNKNVIQTKRKSVLTYINSLRKNVEINLGQTADEGIDFEANINQKDQNVEKNDGLLSIIIKVMIIMFLVSLVFITITIIALVL